MKTDIKSLTGIRGVAAVSVMLYHLSQNPSFAGFRMAVFGRGYLCVDLFFVLSGFILAYIYRDTFLGSGLGSGLGDDNRSQATGSDYGHFLLNRAARIMPLNLVVTLVFTARLLLNVSGDGAVRPSAIAIAANLAMVQGWGFGVQAIAGNSWSVSTEVLAYLLFPLLVWLAFSRLWWLQVAAAVAALAAVAFSGLGSEGMMDVFSPASVLPAVRCLAGFSLGLLAFRLTAHNGVRRWLARDSALVVALLLLGSLFLVPQSDLAIIPVFAVLVMVLFYNGPLADRLFGNAFVYHLGLISYSLYLWHPLVRDIAGRVLDIAHSRGITGIDIVFALGAVAVTWLVSWLSYRFIEVTCRTGLRHLIPARAVTSLDKPSAGTQAAGKQAT